MNNESEQNTQDNGQENEGSSANPTPDAQEEAPSFSKTDWRQKFKAASQDKETADLIDELLRGQQIASVYIDASNRTIFRGSVSGPVHSGQGHIHSDSGHLWDSGQQLGDGAAVAVGRVLGQELDTIQAVYTAPPAYHQAKEQLADKHILILHGQAHHGKRTTALHLLSTAHELSCFEITPNVEWKQLRSSELQQNAGYVIDTLAPDAVEKLNPVTLSRLGSTLSQRNSHLVITVDSRVVLSQKRLSSYVIRWVQMPNPDEVLKQHLDWYLPHEKQRHEADALCQREEVQEILKARPLLADIDRLAQLLADVVSSGEELKQALERFQAYAEQQAETWFEEHTEPEKQTFMLALAVFNGAKYNEVIEVDQRLQSLINPSAKEQKQPANSSWGFGRSRSQRLREAGAELVAGYENTHFGRSAVKHVKLRNPAMQPAILRYVWDQYDTLHKVLLDWLRELGHHASFEIRTRAAAAVGELAKEDFGYIHRHVILPWAKDENSQLRQAAAFALGVPVWEGTLAPQVLGLLHHWSTLPNNWGLCWTAATAYGGLVGLRFPDMALRDLCAIAEHGNPRLLGVLTGSMATLFEAGRLATDYYFKVLDALLAWTSQSRNQTLTPTGLFIYLMLTLNAKVEAEPEGDPWPTLLWLAKENETARKSVISLWRRALNTKSTRQLALTALQQWQYSVDNDSRLYDTQEQIIVELATQGQPHERKRLLSYLKRWATHSRKASPSAGKILKTLHNS